MLSCDTIIYIVYTGCSQISPDFKITTWNSFIYHIRYIDNTRSDHLKLEVADHRPYFKDIFSNNSLQFIYSYYGVENFEMCELCTKKVFLFKCSRQVKCNQIVVVSVLSDIYYIY